MYSGQRQYTLREVFLLNNKKYFTAALCFLAAFVVWTLAVTAVDVRSIGPEGSAVGFAGINGFVHNATGVHRKLYLITDLLSLIPAGFILGFALLGLSQWIRRKSLLQVDRSILILGGFYLITGAAYVFFEKCVINYRPVLMDGAAEASYPSSTTMLAISVMSTAAMQLKNRIRNRSLRNRVLVLITVFTAFMVIARLISGVHWFTDIIGGILLSTGLVLLYASLAE